MSIQSAAFPGSLIGRTRRRFRLAAWMLLLPAVGYLLLLMVYPVGQLLSLSFLGHGGQGWSLENYRRLAAGAVYWRVLGITLRCAAWTTLFSVLFGYPVAYLIATSRDRAKAWLTFWVLLPFWTSFLVRTFAWIVLLGRNGFFSQLLQTVGLTGAPVSMLYSFPAVTIGMLHALMPLCVITMISVMENIDGNLTKAALTLGAPGGSAFWCIYFPLSLPGVAAGGLLVFITSLGFFITPALLGGPREILLPQIIIQQIQEVLNWRFAGALSVLLLAAVLIVFIVCDRVFGLSSLAGQANGSTRGRHGRMASLAQRSLEIVGRGSDAAGRALRRLAPRNAHDQPRPTARWLLFATGGLTLVFLALPAFLMIPFSFTKTSVLDWPPRLFSLRWYHAYLGSEVWLAATLRSIEVALLTGVLAMLIGTAAAFGLMRGVRRGNTALLAMLLSPLIIPRIVIAVALFYLYAQLHLVGTTLGLVLGHTILAVPYVVVTVMAVLKGYDQRYDSAAWSLGANHMRALWHVTLPLLRPGLIAAFLFAFVTSFDDLTIALFVTGGINSTLPKQMWDSAILQVNPTLAAVSTLLLLLITSVLALASWLGRRHRAALG